MDGWTQTLSAQTLLGISAAAIILILILIVKFRIHALLTLVIVSLLTALATTYWSKTSAARSAAWRFWSVWARCSDVWSKHPAAHSRWRTR